MAAPPGSRYITPLPSGKTSVIRNGSGGGVNWTMPLWSDIIRGLSNVEVDWGSPLDAGSAKARAPAAGMPMEARIKSDVRRSGDMSASCRGQGTVYARGVVTGTNDAHE